MTILITNDDGYKSKGLNILYRAARKVFGSDVVVVAPDKLQSSTGMSFTFHKPLRIEKLKYDNMPCLAVSGTPADCVFMAMNHFFRHRIKMVLSGVNNGMNVGLDTVYSSGTISAAIFAAIYKIPSMAFSKDQSDIDPNKIDRNMESVLSKTVFILNKIKKLGFPSGVELLNVNFPRLIKASTKIKVVKSDRCVFDDLVDAKRDPHGREYYWLYGNLRKDLDPDADVKSLQAGNITVTPVDLSNSDETEMSTVKSMFYDSKT